MKKAAPRRGRRSGRPDTRAAILAIARTAFAAQGYDKTSLRAIARDAAVDNALVHHYFGSKRALFAAVTQEAPTGRPGPPHGRTHPGRDGPNAGIAGNEIVAGFLERWDADGGTSILGTLLRAAASDEDAARRLASIVAAGIEAPVARLLAGRASMTKLRTTLIAAQLIGLAWQRYVARVEPAVSASPALLARIYGPSLTATLSGIDFGERDRST